MHRWRKTWIFVYWRTTSFLLFTVNCCCYCTVYMSVLCVTILVWKPSIVLKPNNYTTPFEVRYLPKVYIVCIYVQDIGIWRVCVFLYSITSACCTAPYIHSIKTMHSPVNISSTLQKLMVILLLHSCWVLKWIWTSQSQLKK